MTAPCGVVVCDKPAGVTSHDVVAAARRRLGRGVKVGHAGTLDPFATGVLLLLVGRATRVQRFLMALPKTYVVDARFGAVSSTGDPEGEIVETGVVPAGDLALATGLVRQRPPAYSAVKVGGRRAYALARAGAAVELPEREVRVHRFEELSRCGRARRFLIECSSGTYVRSLIAALGDAYCTALQRVAVGPFRVEQADAERVIGLDHALSFLPAVALGADAARWAAHGGAVAVAVAGDAVAGPVRLLGPEGSLIAVGEPADGGRVKPVVGLAG